MSNACDSRDNIRRAMRQQRRQLTQVQQQQAATAFCARLAQLPEFTQAKTVGMYLAFDGELNLQPCMDLCWQHNKRVVLPRLHPFSAGHLLFFQYRAKHQLAQNKYGIAEPKLDVRTLVPFDAIDLLICPLVAFDAHGNRLGMGGGFYDRTLAAAHRCSTLGAAHDHQRVAQLPVASWDQPLDAYLTPTDLWRTGLN